MSVSLIPIITSEGLQAALNASNDGLQAKITHVALGDFGWIPSTTATALRNECNRVAISNGTRIRATQIHITAVENGSSEYWVREIGFLLDDGTLFAIWSHPTQALAWKAAEVDLLLAFDMVLSALPADSVFVVGTGGVNLAPATLSSEGVVRLASTAEALAGVIATAVVMTPAGNRAHGDARYSKVEHRHDWAEIEAKPETFPPTAHHHDWAEVDNKPAAFPPSLHDHDTRYIQPINLRVATGFVQTSSRYSASGWAGYNDWDHNYADIFPPYGFTMADLQGFMASSGLVYFSGDVDGNDSLWCRWVQRADRIRVICANSENRADTSGIGSYINYLAIWRK